MKLQNICRKSGSLACTLPKTVLKMYGWRKGDELDFVCTAPGTITLFKKRPTEPDMSNNPPYNRMNYY